MRLYGKRQRRSILVPHAVIVGCLHPEGVFPRRQVDVLYPVLVAQASPLVVNTVETAHERILFRGGIAQGREADDNVFVFVVQRDGLVNRDGDIFGYGIVRARAPDLEIGQENRRDIAVAGHPVGIE